MTVAVLEVLAVLAMVSAIALAGCRYLRSKSDIDPYRCDDPTVACPAGRVCQEVSTGERFCVVAGSDAGPGTDANEGTDAADTDAGPPPCDCDDNNLCNGAETCDAAGGCVPGTPLDCSGRDDTCVVGFCSVADGACALAPRPDGTPCTDGLFCTDPDYCTTGVCGGDPRRCGTGCDGCDESGSACTVVAVADGTPCNDDQFCTTGETCTGGTCAGGTTRSCDDARTCTADSCDDAADTCVNDGVPAEGDPCEDGVFCSAGETCAGGWCTGGMPSDCSAAGDVCNTPSCNEAKDACEPLPRPAGTACDDGNPSTTMDVCTFGFCAGT